MALAGTDPQLLPALVQTGYLLVDVWVGVRVVGLAAFSHLVECVHVDLLGSHLFLETL